jgi:glycosyltransferase involved in cell wall biosynthesis
MLNIISRAIVSKRTHGPRKVVENLIQGLDAIGVPYVLNQGLTATQALWIHDDPSALETLIQLHPEIPAVVGPNMYSTPRSLSGITLRNNLVWLSPALWVQQFWQASGFEHAPHAVWPVGIDTTRFTPDSSINKDTVLVYVKQRSNEDVQQVIELLKNRGIPYTLMRYGTYAETEYVHALKRARGIIWIGRSESQGIALLEALAADVPALVWDITSFGSWDGGGKERFTPQELAFTQATAVPYFSSACGLRFTKKEELPTVLETFMEKLGSFSPRTYIAEHLSLAGQAHAFIELYTKHLHLPEAQLRETTLRPEKPWRNATLSFLLKTRIKDAIRAVIR